MDAILWSSTAIFWVFTSLVVGCIITGTIYCFKKEKK